MTQRRIWKNAFPPAIQLVRMSDLQSPAPAPYASSTGPIPDAGDARDSLIVALDFPTSQQALALVDRLEGSCRWYKVGLELFIAAGASVVENLRLRGYSVFLDLKLHDIPNTVASAVKSIAPFGVEMLTIHAGGGPAMLAAAAEAAAGLTHPPTLLAVTVLTSLDQVQLSATGVSRTPGDQALLLAEMATANGIDGFVCSPEEATNLRKALPTAVLVTPGIRPAGSATGDQKRIATPAAALAAGASYLVVGRPITQAADPAAATHAILAEMTR
jgi:orotidine-5'-phosphate decarboxylase